jgi:SCP-2 sterol transfer family
VATHQFLSPEWMEAARAIREELDGQVPPPEHSVRMNQVSTDVPFGTGVINAHLDTTAGDIELEEGHLDQPDVTVTTDYATAKSLFVEWDPQAGMQAFMAGKIKVQGDLSKLLAMQQSGLDPAALAVARRIQAITE